MNPKLYGVKFMDVWYLAHPVSTDGSYKESQNLKHVIKVQKILWDAGLRTINPWFTYIKMFPESRDHKLIEECLKLDCQMIDLVGRIVLTGHRISYGMGVELLAANEADAEVLDLIGVPDSALGTVVKNYLSEGEYGADF